MSLETPTTKELSDNIVASLEASFNQVIPLLPKAFNRVLAKVLAGIFILLYKYGGFIFLQMFVQSASTKDTTILGVTVNPLKFWGRLIGVGDPVAATNAELTIDITVENQIDYLPSGSQLISSDNGFTYITLGDVFLDAATVSATVKAVQDESDGEGVGEKGNLIPGESILSFANPLPNVARDTLVTAVTVVGADAESDDSYRQRIIDRFQKQPQGGAYADYEQWAIEPVSIINVYPYTSDCPGQVDVYVEVEATETNPDGIPTEAQLQEALDFINLDVNGRATRRPANALANTFPIERVGFTTIVSGLVVENEGQVQDDIETSLIQYYLGREPFIDGLSPLPRLDQITQAAVGGIVQDIVAAAGGVFSEVSIGIGIASVNIFTLGIGQKSKSEEVEFVS